MFVKIIDTTCNDSNEFRGTSVLRWYRRDTYVDIHFTDTTSVRYNFKTTAESLKFAVDFANAVKQSLIGSSSVACSTDPDYDRDDSDEDANDGDESPESQTQQPNG